MKRFTAVCFWFCEENQRNSAVTQLELRSVFARSAKLNLKQVHRFFSAKKTFKKPKRSHRCVALSCCQKTKNKVEAGSPLFVWFLPRKQKISGRTAVFCSDRKKPKRAHRCLLWEKMKLAHRCLFCPRIRKI